MKLATDEIKLRKKFCTCELDYDHLRQPSRKELKQISIITAACYQEKGRNQFLKTVHTLLLIRGGLNLCL